MGFFFHFMLLYTAAACQRCFLLLYIYLTAIRLMIEIKIDDLRVYKIENELHLLHQSHLHGPLFCRILSLVMLDVHLADNTGPVYLKGQFTPQIKPTYFSSFL